MQTFAPSHNSNNDIGIVIGFLHKVLGGKNNERRFYYQTMQHLFSYYFKPVVTF